MQYINILLEIYVHTFEELLLQEKYTAVIYNSLLTFLDIIDGRIYGPHFSSLYNLHWTVAH